MVQALLKFKGFCGKILWPFLLNLVNIRNGEDQLLNLWKLIVTDIWREISGAYFQRFSPGIFLGKFPQKARFEIFQA